MKKPQQDIWCQQELIRNQVYFQISGIQDMNLFSTYSPLEMVAASGLSDQSIVQLRLIGRFLIDRMLTNSPVIRICVEESCG